MLQIISPINLLSTTNNLLWHWPRLNLSISMPEVVAVARDREMLTLHLNCTWIKQMLKIQTCYTNSNNSSNLLSPARIRPEGSSSHPLPIRTISSPKNKPLRTIVGWVEAGIPTKLIPLYTRLPLNPRGKILWSREGRSRTTRRYCLRHRYTSKLQINHSSRSPWVISNECTLSL